MSDLHISTNKSFEQVLQELRDIIKKWSADQRSYTFVEVDLLGETKLKFYSSGELAAFSIGYRKAIEHAKKLKLIKRTV